MVERPPIELSQLIVADNMFYHHITLTQLYTYMCQQKTKYKTETILNLDVSFRRAGLCGVFA